MISPVSKISNGVNVLMITGDKNLFVDGTSAHLRLRAQQSVASVTPIYWGRGALFGAFMVGGTFDVVTVQDPFWRGMVALIIARLRGSKLNVQLHADLQAETLVRHLLAQVVLRHADSVRVVSEKLKKQVESIGVRAPISVLPFFVDLERFKNIERSSARTDATKSILWIGRFENEKDPLSAISILEAVLQSGIKAKLTMLGTGSLDAALKARARTLPVEFPGWQDPLPYLAQADVCISTSRAESYGGSIVEALAAGVPVVAPDIGIAKEAGATVVQRSELASAVTNALRESKRGMLLLPVVSREAWASAWLKTL